MKLIQKLQECSTLGQADPILTKLGAGPAVKKLVETAIVLNNSQDPQQRSHAYSFMESAIKELEDDKSKIHEEEDDEYRKNNLHEEEDDEHKEREAHNNDEHKLHEEELSNHNLGSRTDGSDQSTHNTEPYPGEGKDTTNGEKPMQDMDGTINQWNETDNGMIVGGLPPVGMEPGVAREMGKDMAPLKQMDTSQMMRQIQYTVNRAFTPLQNKIQKQENLLNRTFNHYKEAIRSISQELRETKSASGSMKLDLDSMRKNAPATFRETVPVENQPSFDGMGIPGVQPQQTRHKDKIDVARAEIEQMNKIMNSTDSIYN